MSKLSENFDSSEFKCHCCGELPVGGMDSRLIKLLQSIREKVGTSITIMSGYRCENHNQKVGGAKHSQHVMGTAADIKIAGMDAGEVQLYLTLKFNQEIGGMGCYKTFTHIDVRSNIVRWTG